MSCEDDVFFFFFFFWGGGGGALFETVFQPVLNNLPETGKRNREIGQSDERSNIQTVSVAPFASTGGTCPTLS